ncbi:D-sedoheptulose 7-phosphate isomerase [Magnetospira sp. QH-2]|uniref:D-sedoheptulose-7-phosphate isomerase n=1 Tax=Magnetospira sp. (strain QH-2) TaxID=1288970 RepID=UPI0011DE399B
MEDSITVKQALLADTALVTQIETICGLVIDTYRNGNKTLLAGNGGSAADAQHLATEFVCRYIANRPALPSIALTTDTSILTAVSNDFGYEELFRRQLEANGKPGDLFIGISTSGNSPNILRALEACKGLGITSIGMTGQDGGKMAELCNHCIRVPSTHTPRIQESHILIGHILCDAVETALFG